MPIGLGAAMLGGSLISGGLGLAGVDKAKESASKATEYALWAENYNRKKAKKILEPVTSAGTDALRQIAAGGIDYQGMIDGLENDPFYQFQLNQGLDAIRGNAVTAGMLDSGRTLKELMGYGQGMAASQLQQGYNRELNRRNELMNLAGFGVNALGSIAGRDSIVPQVAANTALQNAQYDMQKAQIGSDMFGGMLQGGLLAGSGVGLKDLLGLPSGGNR